MPKAIARQLDRCDVCGKKIHRKDLVRTNARNGRPAGSNYFLYSSYDGTFWTTDGNCSLHSERMGIGPDAEDSRAKISSDNTVTEIKGSETFLLDSSPAIIYTASPTDISGFDSFVFSVYVGQYHCNADPAVLTVEIGNCNSDASVLYELKGVTTRSGRHVWVSANLSDLDSNVDTSAAYFYIRVTASSDEDYYFWVDWMQLVKDSSTPGAFIKTSGASVEYETDATIMTSVKVCKRCREPLLKESEKYGRHRVEVEPPILDDFEEA